jgi:hypothetical protein
MVELIFHLFDGINQFNREGYFNQIHKKRKEIKVYEVPFAAFRRRSFNSHEDEVHLPMMDIQRSLLNQPQLISEH